MAIIQDFVAAAITAAYAALPIILIGAIVIFVFLGVSRALKGGR